MPFRTFETKEELDSYVKDRVFALEATLAILIHHLLAVGEYPDGSKRVMLEANLLQQHGQELADRLHREILPDGTNVWIVDAAKEAEE